MQETKFIAQVFCRTPCSEAAQDLPYSLLRNLGATCQLPFPQPSPKPPQKLPWNHLQPQPLPATLLNPDPAWNLSHKPRPTLPQLERNLLACPATFPEPCPEARLTIPLLGKKLLSLLFHGYARILHTNLSFPTPLSHNAALVFGSCLALPFSKRIGGGKRSEQWSKMATLNLFAVHSGTSTYPTDSGPSDLPGALGGTEGWMGPRLVIRLRVELWGGHYAGMAPSPKSPSSEGWGHCGLPRHTTCCGDWMVQLKRYPLNFRIWAASFHDIFLCWIPLKLSDWVSWLTGPAPLQCSLFAFDLSFGFNRILRDKEHLPGIKWSDEIMESGIPSCSQIDQRCHCDYNAYVKKCIKSVATLKLDCRAEALDLSGGRSITRAVVEASIVWVMYSMAQLSRALRCALQWYIHSSFELMGQVSKVHSPSKFSNR